MFRDASLKIMKLAGGAFHGVVISFKKKAIRTECKSDNCSDTTMLLKYRNKQHCYIVYIFCREIKGFSKHFSL